MGVQYRGEPEFVIEGNPSGIRGRVASMKTCSESFDQVGESLGGVETEHWVGKAADRFRSRLEEEPRRWTGVADGFRSAAAALEGYAAALEAAQQAAQVCKENYEEGKRVSATAKADYDRDVSEGFQKKAAWEAQNGPGSSTLTITPFTDPGQALCDRAVADFQAVIEDLEKTGSDTEQAVAQAHADADPTRQWPNKAGVASPAGNNASAAAPAKKMTPDEKNQEFGVLESEIEEEWKKLTEEERKRVLQAMLDEEFAKDGMKAPKISFESSEELYGEWRQNGLGHKELMVNQILVKDSVEARWAINTIAHEARHAEQHQLDEEVTPKAIDYRMGPREREAKEKHREDLLKQHNVTPEEVHAWHNDFNPPPWDPLVDLFKTKEEKEEDYWNQSIEVDARGAGRYFVNSMTPEEFENYKSRAGVK